VINMDIQVTYFDQKGPVNTEATLRIAQKRAAELGIEQVVIASTYGEAARKALEIFDSSKVNVVVVTISYGFKNEGWIMEEEVRKELEEKGAKVLTSIHALEDDVSSSFSSQKGGFSANQIVAETLRRFSKGVKVAVEITLMAAEAGFIDVEKETISIGGTDRGVDTAIVVKPAYARNFLDFEIREILAKPRIT